MRVAREGRGVLPAAVQHHQQRQAIAAAHVCRAEQPEAAQARRPDRLPGDPVAGRHRQAVGARTSPRRRAPAAAGGVRAQRERARVIAVVARSMARNGGEGRTRRLTTLPSCRCATSSRGRAPAFGRRADVLTPDDRRRAPRCVRAAEGELADGQTGRRRIGGPSRGDIRSRRPHPAAALLARHRGDWLAQVITRPA